MGPFSRDYGSKKKKNSLVHGLNSIKLLHTIFIYFLIVSEANLRFWSEYLLRYSDENCSFDVKFLNSFQKVNYISLCKQTSYFQKS